MNIEARKRCEIYSEMPAIHVLAEQLQQGSVAGKRQRSPATYLWWLFAVFFLLFCVTAAISSFLPVELQPWARLLVVISHLLLLLFLLLYAAMVVVEAFPILKSAFNPARELGTILDEQMEAEEGLICKLVGVPACLLLERRERLDMQIALLDRRVKTARLFGVIGPLLLIVGRAVIDKGTVGVLPLAILYVASVLGGLLVGVYFGAILVRFGIEQLHRVSYVLKKASEQYQIGGRTSRWSPEAIGAPPVSL